MSTLFILLFIQLCNFQNLWKSVGVIVVDSSLSHHRVHSQDRHSSKDEKTLPNNKTNVTGNHKGKNVFRDDFVIDGLGEFVDSLGTYDEIDKEDASYPPIPDTTFVYHNNGRSGQRETKHDPDSLQQASKGDRHRNIITEYSYGSFFPVPFNEDSFNDDAFSDRGIDSSDPVYRKRCPEKCVCEGTQLTCVGKNLTSVPKGISPSVTGIDLSMNNIKSFQDDSFAHLPNLMELRCMENSLTDLPPRLFKKNKFLRILNFQGNLFQTVPSKALQNLHYLLELHLDANEITTIPKNAFTGLSYLKHLRLDDNKLDSVPTKAFRLLVGLEALTMIKNRITHLQDYAFQNNTKLIHLRLANNAINTVEDNAFYGLTKLKNLKLQQNKITTIPSAFSHLVSLEELNLDDNLLTQIKERSFVMKNKLTRLTLDNNPITFVATGAFKNLPSLKEIKLSSVHDMNTFPDLRGTGNIRSLVLNRAPIMSIPEDLCDNAKKLKLLDLHGNKISVLPKMSQCKSLQYLDVAKNHLISLDGELFYGMDKLTDLNLHWNFIDVIADNTFVGLGTLEYLDLSTNQIRLIHPNAFLPLKSLRELNLGNNKFQHLPTAGLVNLVTLKVFNTPDLQEFPPAKEFPKVKLFVMSYAYFCCDLMQAATEAPGDEATKRAFIGDSFDLPEHINTSSHLIGFFRPMGDNASEYLEKHFDSKNLTIDFDHWGKIAANSKSPESQNQMHTLENMRPEDYRSNAVTKPTFVPAKSPISCKPLPGPFQPCEDLFDWWSLRCGIWLVLMLALLGNGAVFCVSVTSRSKMDVTRFLICNLAAADFLMGIYLGILATMDSSSLGNFRKYGIKWQTSAWCSVAGTLGVLSSELSVFTLTVITLERFYAITHAIQLNKRLSLKHAGFVMLCGWIWSFGLAILPLFGVSDYRKFAVCLPFEIEDPISKSYVCFLLAFNGVSFFIIMGCYLIMYISIRRSKSWNSNDFRVAKRMALLVFTDLLCWAPIAVLALAAAFGRNLVHLNMAKVLTIFVLPLNSCANPFLYAFFTKQFKKDCVFLCRRLDSFLTRTFSQTGQRHVSLSWKNQHQHPSTLQSLVGESKTNNSHNNSSGSNSFGLPNYNSEISTGTSKAGQGATKFEEYIIESQTYSATSSDDHCNGRTNHKYIPFPYNGNEHGARTTNNIFTDVHKCDDDNYVQVTCDHNVPHRRWMAKDGCFSDTHISDDNDDDQFTFSDDDNLHEDCMGNSYSHQEFTRAVIQDNQHATAEEDGLRKKTTQQSPAAEIKGKLHNMEQEIYINIKQVNQVSQPHKWQINGFRKNYKDYKMINSHNDSCLLEKSLKHKILENNI